MALHEQSVGVTDEWYTPPRVFDALGCTFDMDVASPGREITPWIPAKTFITENSLTVPWVGFVWMNGPFGPRNGYVPWLAKFCRHANGIALAPDRTSAPWWQIYAAKAELILFAPASSNSSPRMARPETRRRRERACSQSDRKAVLRSSAPPPMGSACCWLRTIGGGHDNS